MFSDILWQIMHFTPSIFNVWFISNCAHACIIYSLCGGHSHLVPDNNMLWRVPSFPKYHQTSITFYRHELPLRQCTKPDICCYGKLNYSSGSIKLTCQFVIIDTLSQCHLHNELAMRCRFDTFQSQSNHAFIIDTLSQCNLHNELAVYCRYGTFQSVPPTNNHGCIIGTRIH